MFETPFSFEGRIRRSEFVLSFLSSFVLLAVVLYVMERRAGMEYLGVTIIPLTWFFLAQGWKRCHDLGRMGIFLFVPFYFLWMLFADSEYGDNQYGPNPKGEGNMSDDEMDMVAEHLID